MAHVERGYTLVIKDAALLNARLQRFSNRLQRDLGTYVQVNVYLTPAAAQGFDVHHDTHDTLTLQLEGEKTWRIYEPLVELPLESQPFHSGTKVEGLRLLREVTLRCGETLYIPRGYPHEAAAGGGSSLHATFALLPLRVVDLLDEALRAAADADVELRRALRPGWHDDPAFAARFAAALGPRLAALLAPERIAAAGETVLRGLFATTRGTAAGGFGQIEALAELDALGPSARLRLDETVPFLVRDRGTGLELLIAGKSLGFPSLCAAAFRRLQAGPTTVADLDPALSPQNRRTLITALLLEGLLIIDTT